MKHRVSWIMIIPIYGLYFITMSQLSACRNSENPPTSASSGSDSRSQRVENGLIPIDPSGQPMPENKLSLTERMAYYNIPGVSITVIDNYEIDWAKGYGVVEAGGIAPVTVDTLFHAGSIAKTLSAAAAMKLVEEGLLDLDRNLNDYLTSWQVPENSYTQDEKVTLRRLLSHSAGLEDGFTNRSSSDPPPEYLTPAGEAPGISIQQLLDAAPGIDVDGITQVSMVPGAQYSYANADYAILELLFDDLDQGPFDKMMADKILKPLGMTASTFEQPLPELLRTKAAVEHYENGQPFDDERLHFPFRAAGGLWTTPSDLARYAVEIMMAYRGQSEELITQDTALEMLSSQIEVQGNPFFDKSGLGYQLAGEGESLAVHHTGGTWGSSAILIFYPETGQGAAVMSNKTLGNSPFLLEILLSIAEEYEWP